jgi:ABC-type branched-subunit amino acid transport system permease subunit
MSYRFRPVRGTDGEFELDVGWEGWRLVRGSRSFSEIVMTAVFVGALVSMLAVVWLPALEGRRVSEFVALSVALLGLQFSVGIAGQLSLCHGVFVGIGSYTAPSPSAASIYRRSPVLPSHPSPASSPAAWSVRSLSGSKRRIWGRSP